MKMKMGDGGQFYIRYAYRHLSMVSTTWCYHFEASVFSTEMSSFSI